MKNRVERLEKETDEEQVARARRIGTSLGDVMSRTQLGYRVSGKSTQPLPRMWLVEALPKTWDVDSVKTMLEQHFHQVSQRRRKGDSDFFFEAVAKTDVDLVSLPVGEDGAPMLYWARWAPVRKVPAQCKQVRQVIAWNLRAESSTKVEVQAATATPAVDEKGKPVFAPRRRVINARAVPDDVEVAQAFRDGSCLYHAFAQAAGTMYDMKLDPLTLRAEVVITHRAKHADRYLPIWCGEAPDGSRLWNDKQTAEEIQEAFKQYLKLEKVDGAWGGELELAALGRKYNIKIVIVPKCADFMIAAMHETRPKCIALWFTGDRFDMLKLETIDWQNPPKSLGRCQCRLDPTHSWRWQVHHKYCMDSQGHQLPNQAQTWLTLCGQFPRQREAIKWEDSPKAIDCERWSRAKGTEFC